jgi:hypothetical protein
MAWQIINKKKMATKISDKEQVTNHIQKLEPHIGPLIEKIRQIILTTDPEIGERIKWNNPSFYFNGDMKPFDPKEYKREIIVMNLHKGRIMLVWPSGAKLTNNDGILEGEYSDGRRLLIFKDEPDINLKEARLRSLLKEWLSLVVK